MVLFSSCILQTTQLDVNLCGLGVDAANLDTTTTSKLVHGMQTNVEAVATVVNGKDGDATTLVLERPACAARGRVPARDGLGTANEGKARNLVLRLPVVTSDETVVTI